MDLGPLRWHGTRSEEDTSVEGMWNSDWGHTEETAAAGMYEGRLWEAVTPFAERHLKAVHCGRRAHDRARLAAMAVNAVYVAENDLRWTSRFAMTEEYRRREWVGHARNKLLSLDRCSAWYATGTCRYGNERKYAHIREDVVRYSW